MANQSFRMKFMFWLDSAKPDEDRLIEQVEQLKQNRLFTRTLRDGIRLICDLRAGNIEVLMELFPWVREAMQQPAPVSTDQRLQEQIARLEALLLAQGNVPVQRAEPAQPRVEIATEKSNTKTVAQNFMDSMKGFASGFFD